MSGSSRAGSPGCVTFIVFVTFVGGGVPAACLYAPLYVLNIMFAHNVPVGDANLVGHTWSLTIEVQFYVAWATVLLYLEQRGVSRRILLALTIAVSVGSLGVRAFYQLGLLDPALAYFSTESRLDGLFLGTALAVVAAIRPTAFKPLAQPAIALTSSTSHRPPRGPPRPGFTLLSITQPRLSSRSPPT